MCRCPGVGKGAGVRILKAAPSPGDSHAQPGLKDTGARWGLWEEGENQILPVLPAKYILEEP